MKIGFHFNADHESLGSFYGRPITERFFKLLMQKKNLNVSTKIFIGDLLLMQYSCDKETKESTSEGITTFTQSYKFNPTKYNNLFNGWLLSAKDNWKKFDSEKLKDAKEQNIFVLCLESIDLKSAEYIDSELKDFAPYIGVMEIDETNGIHWLFYGNSLIPYARIINKKLNLFHEYGDDDLDYGAKQEYQTCGFEKVDFECLNYRYTIFDKYHDYEHARRIAEWEKKFGSFLAFIADDVVSRLSDIAPDLGNKLWSALNTFENAETNEQLAQVVTTCRRIFEYVTDCILPPVNEISDSGHSLKADKYKNRLYEFAKQTRQSNTNIDLISASTDVLFDQWEKLNNLANKGVHSEVFRNETRRCFIRTVLLLDDIISLKGNAFEIIPELDFDDFFNAHIDG